MIFLFLLMADILTGKWMKTCTLHTSEKVLTGMCGILPWRYMCVSVESGLNEIRAVTSSLHDTGVFSLKLERNNHFLETLCV